jgi:hypothetical protein
MMKKLLMGLFVTAVAGLPLAHANEWDDMKAREAGLEQKGKNLQTETKTEEQRGENLEQRGEHVRDEGEHARDTGERDYKSGRDELHDGVTTTESYEHKASKAYHGRKKHVTKTTTTTTRDTE